LDESKGSTSDPESGHPSPYIWDNISALGLLFKSLSNDYVAFFLKFRTDMKEYFYTKQARSCSHAIITVLLLLEK
jgi:hypothetical protein